MSTIRPKKSLGQNFLRSSHAIEQIMSAADISPGDIIVEVGPGEGVLTNELLLAGGRVIAIEKDIRCVAHLNERFSDALDDGHLQLIDGDILDPLTTHMLFEEMLRDIPSYKVVANIPYYITGLLFRYFLEEHRQPSSLTFLVQKEVAEQIVSVKNKESLLSLSVKVFGDPHYVGKVGKESFSPAPKVDSAIITINNISKDRLSGLAEQEFFRILKAGFRAKRKKLVNNLADGLEKSKEELSVVFDSVGIDLSARGEDLPVDDWIRLAKALI